ncbi:MAG: hypothetical protein DMD47_03535 [Gemmatimonadetes bacterium]|nr:MAG: hypothetical protein DMD47_03535 [Gemmatimonadota bacterium]
MPKGSSKSTAQIQRLLEERRQYEAWLARLSAAAGATPDQVRGRVRADYEARLEAVIEELKVHAASARQAIEQKQHHRAELQRKEASVAEKLTETELRHAVGEYDEAQWSQVHKDILAELVAVREELQAIDADIGKLQELDALVRDKQPPPPKGAAPPQRKTPQDEMAFIKSVTEDDKGAGPSPTRASGAQFQPVMPTETPRAPSSVRAATPAPAPILPQAGEGDGDEEAAKTLKCKDCGTMNLPTEWYCENCGAELAAM